MSIQSFVDAALILYDNEKYNEALCLTCIAIDACAAKKYPNKKVSDRYKQFLKDHFTTICKFGFIGINASSIRIKVNVPVKNLKADDKGYVGMEEIIYHVLRCGLVHDCNIEEAIEFTDRSIVGDWNENKFYLPKTLIYGLIEATKQT